MAGVQPVAVYALKVPPGDIIVPAVPSFAAMFRVSMAAIDPTEELDEEDKGKKPPRATLKLIRAPNDFPIIGDDSDDDDEAVNGELSGPSKIEEAKNKSVPNGAPENESEEDIEDDDIARKALLSNLLKGKAPATGDEEDDEDDSLDIEGNDLEETVICTLEPEKHYQQPLDLVVGEDEKIFFKVSGTHTIHLTGNYVIPTDDGQASMYDGDQDGYDLSPDEDELDDYDEDEDEEEDELDDIEDPRVMEIDTDEEEPPKLVKGDQKKAGKGKNKRSAPDSSDEEPASLDDIMAKSLKPVEPAADDEPKLSKRQLKKLKKQKKNDGQAVDVGVPVVSDEKPDTGRKESSTNGEKKVQFAEKLEQGPTPSPAAKASDSTSSASATVGVKTVQGVKIDDRKLGKGPAAKKGDRVGVRYIGKLPDTGKVFDANKKGKPFSFKVGAGEVIKGWDIGIIGMSVGAERRITIPASLAYGSKGSPPDIPPNATLQFDLKMLELK